MIGLEVPTTKRFFGLSLGLVAVIVILAPGQSFGASLSLFGIGIILTATLCYAVGKIILADETIEDDLHPVWMVAAVMTVAALLGLPFAVVTGAPIVPSDLWSLAGVLIAGLGVVSTISTLVIVIVIRLTGAVFSSQASYTATGAGVVWSILLLGESMTIWTAGALALLFAGLLLVMPRDREKDVDQVFAEDPTLEAARARLGI